MNIKLSITTYIGLFLIIVIGVVGGNMVSNGITTYLAAKAAQEVAAKLQADLESHNKKARVEQEKQKQRNAEAAALAEQRAREMRSNSPEGRRLAKTCAEWSNAHSVLNGFTTGIEYRRSCEKLERYLQSGIPEP